MSEGGNMVTMPVPKGFYVTSPFGPRAGGYHWGTDYGRGPNGLVT